MEPLNLVIQLEDGTMEVTVNPGRDTCLALKQTISQFLYHNKKMLCSPDQQILFGAGTPPSKILSPSHLFQEEF